MITFNCSKCGACCRVVGCKYLTKDNLCSIYESRPYICRVNKMYEIRRENGMTLTNEEYYKLTEVFCKYLRKREKEV